MLKTLAAALALLAIAAPAAAAHDAEIFATNNTAAITDPDDPRLQARLHRFADRVERIVEEGGARSRGSELLDGDLDRAVIDDSDDDYQSSVSFLSGRVSALVGGVIATFAGAEPTDRLRVNGNGGRDIVSASTDAMTLTLDGGDGAGVILGGPGRDTLIGGDDFDDVKGGRGDDVAYLAGDFDRFSWAPGDGSDSVDGGASRDSLFFAGSADAETFELEGDRFTRDVGGIVMELDDVEVVDAVAGPGADTFRIGGSDVGELNASLSPGGGAADPDRVEIRGTEGDDKVVVTGKKVVFGSATVTGLPVKLGITFAQAAFDTLAIDTLGGDDTVDTSGLGPDVIGLS